MKVAKLHNQIQAFAWGSVAYLPELLGYENSQKKPQAELWMGVHPLGESYIAESSAKQISLSQYLLDSDGTLNIGLGKNTAAKYHNLPFLFKVLAASTPLSIQAHPNKNQAIAGFARENTAGIALNEPERNYKDTNHKPEITLALTPFWALCGFRPMEKIAQHFGYFANDGLLSFNDHKSFFANLMGLKPEQKTNLLNSALKNLANFTPDIKKWVACLTELYPNDLGALAPLYLNLFCLNPGQAVFLPAGILHAYLEGSAMELMANSDNVLRGGLTPKHQDIPELMKILAFAEFMPCIIEESKMDLHRSYYPVSAEEFHLECWKLNSENSALYIPFQHPVMLAFVYQGCAEINGVILQQGESCIIPAGSGAISAKNAEIGDKDAILYVALAKDI